MSPENSSRTECGFSETRSSCAGIWFGIVRRAVLARHPQLLCANAQPHAIAQQAARKVGPCQFVALKSQAARIAARIERRDLRLEQVRDTHQPRHLHAGGLFQNLARRSALHDAAFPEYQHLIGKLEAFLEIVRHQKNRDLEIGADFAQKGVKLCAQRCVQAARRFVQQ